MKIIRQGIKTEEMKDFNLKSPHVSCLYYLFKNESLTAKQLCDICDEDKAAISRSIEYLEKNNYLICDSKTEKRYKSPIMLTKKGKDVGKAIAEKIDNILIVASNGLTDADRQNFYKSLLLINHSFYLSLCLSLNSFCAET